MSIFKRRKTHVKILPAFEIINGVMVFYVGRIHREGDQAPDGAILSAKYPNRINTGKIRLQRIANDDVESLTGMCFFDADLGETTCVTRVGYQLEYADFRDEGTREFFEELRKQREAEEKEE